MDGDLFESVLKATEISLPDGTTVKTDNETVELMLAGGALLLMGAMACKLFAAKSNSAENEKKSSDTSDTSMYL